MFKRILKGSVAKYGAGAIALLLVIFGVVPDEKREEAAGAVAGVLVAIRFFTDLAHDKRKDNVAVIQQVLDLPQTGKVDTETATQILDAVRSVPTATQKDRAKSGIRKIFHAGPPNRP